MPMPQSIIRKVNRHARQDRVTSKLTFGNRNNRLYDDVDNEEYNDQREGLIEEEPSPFPDIPSELPGVELVEHREGIPALTELNEQAETVLQARRAAENAGLETIDIAGQGPHLIEDDIDELDDNSRIDLEVDSKILNDQGAAPNCNDDLSLDDNGLPHHKGGLPSEETGGLLDQENSTDDDSECSEDNPLRCSK